MPLKRSIRTRPPAGSDGARTVIDQQNYLPIFFASIANTWSRGASKVFLQHFGVGSFDWVVISVLAIEPGITALGICAKTSADKASVSRCVAQLQAKGLLAVEASAQDRRRLTLELTPEGYALHDRLMAIAVKREDQLLQGMTAVDVMTLVKLLQRVQANIVKMQARDAAAVISDDPEAW